MLAIPDFWTCLIVFVDEKPSAIGELRSHLCASRELSRAAHRARHRRVDGRVRRTITRLRLGLGNTRLYPSHDGRNGRQTGHRQIL